MADESSIVAAVAALAGSVVGGLSSFATTWTAQRYQGRRERLARLMDRREILYAEFIEQASSLFIDAMEAEAPDAIRLVGLYKVAARIRLAASDAVIAATEHVLFEIVRSYNAPPISSREVFSRVRDEVGDPLREFTSACRAERDADFRTG